MRNFLQKLVVQTVWSRLQKERPGSAFSRFQIAKGFVKLRVGAAHHLKGLVLMVLGVAAAGFGLKGFLLPNHFIDGGVTGISLLTSLVTDYPLSYLIVLINLPFIILGYKQINKVFAMKSIVAILILAAVVTFINYPVITSDKLLVAVFGGFFLGAGIGLTIRGGGVIDGTEILAIYVSKRTSLTIGDIILVFNILIFSVAAWFLGIETALYSILTYLAASKTVDFIVEGVEEYTGVTIISAKSEEIRTMIIEKLGRGVTMYYGKRGYGKRGDDLNKIDIVYTVITRLEIAKLKSETEKIDPNVFMVMSSVKDTQGGMIKKRPLKQ